MTNRPAVALLALCLTSITTGVAAQPDTEEARVRVIEPEQKRRDSTVAAIDTERFELGFYVGNLSVEDFGSDLVSGVELSYHLNNDWMLQLNYGQASIDRAAFETGQFQFLADADRDFTYLAFTGGYQLLRGRSFFGARRKYDSHLYIIAGPEKVEFANNSETGLNLGLSYRFVFTDWLTANVDFREHFFERSFIGDTKKTFNTELRIGVNALF